MVVYIALSKLHIAAASPSGMQRFGREREREYMHNPAPGCLQFYSVRMCVCVSVCEWECVRETEPACALT